MGLQPDLTPRPWWRRIKSNSAVIVAGSVIALASSAIWLVRDARGLFGDAGPEKGSLVVNVNTATSGQLQTIQGIGPARAQIILDRRAIRPFDSIDDLKAVKGMPDDVIENSRAYIVFDGKTRDYDAE